MPSPRLRSPRCVVNMQAKNSENQVRYCPQLSYQNCLGCSCVVKTLRIVLMMIAIAMMMVIINIGRHNLLAKPTKHKKMSVSKLPGAKWKNARGPAPWARHQGPNGGIWAPSLTYRELLQYIPCLRAADHYKPATLGYISVHLTNVPRGGSGEST